MADQERDTKQPNNPQNKPVPQVDDPDQSSQQDQRPGGQPDRQQRSDPSDLLQSDGGKQQGDGDVDPDQGNPPAEIDKSLPPSGPKHVPPAKQQG